MVRCTINDNIKIIYIIIFKKTFKTNPVNIYFLTFKVVE